jgi:glucoamylase
MLSDDPVVDRDLDFAVIMAVLHADLPSGPHSIADCRVQQTFATLERIFALDYGINRRRPGQAPAIGRFRGDTYQGGGPFYLCTLAAAEFHYRLAAGICSGQICEAVPEVETFLANAGVNGTQRGACELTSAFISRGDAFMATVRQFTPPSGILSEQFDKEDGHQTSARDLAWSHAAFITASNARRAALKAAASKGIYTPGCVAGERPQMPS